MNRCMCEVYTGVTLDTMDYGVKGYARNGETARNWSRETMSCGQEGKVKDAAAPGGLLM